MLARLMFAYIKFGARKGLADVRAPVIADDSVSSGLCRPRLRPRS